MKRLQNNLPSAFAAMMLVALSTLAATGARAELRPVFDQLKLYNSPATLPTIEVEAEGQDWTSVSTETLHVTTNYYVSLKKGDILSIIATQGLNVAQSRFPGGGKRRWGEFEFQLPKITYGHAILACNRKKLSGANTNGTHTTFVDLGFKLFVQAWRGGNSATRLVDGDVQAKVVCKRAPKLVTISHFAVKVDNSSDTCPKNAVVQVGFSTNRDDRIDFTLDHMNSELRTSEHFVQPFLIGGQYTATKLIDLVVDSNTRYVEVRLKDGSDSRRWRASGPSGTPITCPRSFKVTSAWLKYDVEDKDTCPQRVIETATFKATAPGRAPFEIKTQAGLVVHSGTADFKLTGTEYIAKSVRPNLMMNAFDQDMMAQIKDQPDANSGWMRLKVECVEALSGTLTLKSLGATSCKGEALVAIHTSGAGEVPYELECGPGRSWQRNVAAHANNIGVDKLRFDVTNNERVTCVLRTRSGNALKSLDGASETFRCHKPVGVSGSTDLVPETRDDSQGPRNPGPVADPVRTCPAGTVGQWPKCKKQVCPNGTVGKWPKCKKQVCPNGTVGKWPKCKKQVCPHGQVGKWPKCKKQVCPHGQVGKWPNCRKRGCPPGQVRVRDRCIKPAG